MPAGLLIVSPPTPINADDGSASCARGAEIEDDHERGKRKAFQVRCSASSAEQV